MVSLFRFLCRELGRRVHEELTMVGGHYPLYRLQNADILHMPSSYKHLSLISNNLNHSRASKESQTGRFIKNPSSPISHLILKVLWCQPDFNWIPTAVAPLPVPSQAANSSEYSAIATTTEKKKDSQLELPALDLDFSFWGYRAQAWPSFQTPSTSK